MHKFYLAMGLTALFVTIMLPMSVCHALDISISPAHAQRRPNNHVTVYIYAENAIDLISMGVKVTYTPSVFEVVEAHKYEDFAEGWVMDADGVDDGTPDQFFLPDVEIDVDTVADEGTVTMIGGRLMGSDTDGLSGKVLLGWIKFKAVGLGHSLMDIDVAKVHPNDPTNTFDNFVQLDGQVVEPAPVSFLEFCVIDDACEGDADGDGSVNFVELALLRANFNKPCTLGTPCLGDFNGDGSVNFGDLAVLRRDFNRLDCPTCEP